MSQAVLRSASLYDIPAIADTHLQGRRAGYRDFLSAETLLLTTQQDLEELWTKFLEDRELATTVCEVEDRIVGVVCCGAAHPPWPVGNSGIVEALYVLPDHWGAGYGSLLLRDAESRLAASAFATSYLGVYGANKRSRSFYEKRGWVADGFSWDYQVGNESAQMVRYRKDLSS